MGLGGPHRRRNNTLLRKHEPVRVVDTLSESPPNSFCQIIFFGNEPSALEKGC